MPGKSREPSRKRATATSSAAMSAAVARGPMRPASRAMRSAGKPRLVRRPEVEAGQRDEVRRRRGRGPTIGIGQGVLDRKSHVGGAQLCLQ